MVTPAPRRPRLCGRCGVRVVETEDGRRHVPLDGETTTCVDPTIYPPIPAPQPSARPVEGGTGLVHTYLLRGEEERVLKVSIEGGPTLPLGSFSMRSRSTDPGLFTATAVHITYRRHHDGVDWSAWALTGVMVRGDLTFADGTSAGSSSKQYGSLERLDEHSPVPAWLRILVSRWPADKIDTTR